MIVGGITGFQTEGTITKCTNQGNIVAEKQQAGGIAGRQGLEEYEAIIQECSNMGRVEAKSEGVAGGIAGAQYGNNATVTNVYNSGEVVVTNKPSGKRWINGGIIGYQLLGSLSRAYNKGNITGGDAIGGIIGFQNLAGTIEKTYYTNSELNGIGIQTDGTTQTTPVEDEIGKTEKVTEIIETFEKFLTWIATK